MAAPVLLVTVFWPPLDCGKTFASVFLATSIRENNTANKNIQSLMNLLYTHMMNKKIVAALSLVLIVAGALFFSKGSKNQLSSPLINQPKEIIPSETLIEYTDPAGFAFVYPDNLSLKKNEEIDDSTYASLQLSSKDVSGSLNLEISDSKFVSIDDWLKLNQGSKREVKLGNLKALEVKLTDRLLLGALDQGVLFTIEMPLVEEDFWMKVYNQILTEFSFAPPSKENVGTSSDDVIFEGEEVVEQ